MPILLRLPADLEDQIAAFAAGLGLTKSAVITRSIQEFLVCHAQPSSFQIYEEVMREMAGCGDDAQPQIAIGRPQKQAAVNAIRRKHARRADGETQVQAQFRKRTAGAANST